MTGARPAEIAERITWHDAMERFGSDKPDLRFGLELVELTAVFAETTFNAFKAPCVKGIRVPGAGDHGRNRLDALTDQAKRWGPRGWCGCGSTGDDGDAVVSSRRWPSS